MLKNNIDNSRHTLIPLTEKSEDVFKLNETVINYSNFESASQIIHEIYGTDDYHFFSSKTSPYIIDAGSNIGISVLFFKYQYPSSHILSFEPDPNAFSLLQKNIHQNNLMNVVPIQAALAGESGELDFYGQLSSKSSDARGNSILPEWGCQRLHNQVIKVPAKCLSKYLDRPVDCLKLDIEGAEQQVLEEAYDNLHWVENIIMESHFSKTIKQRNSHNKVVELLERAGFKLSIKENDMKKMCEENLLPNQIKNWVNHLEPKLYLIKATRA